ncbi:hypothetical protein IWQ62_001944, partial [Dispira parvispora]
MTFQGQFQPAPLSIPQREYPPSDTVTLQRHSFTPSEPASADGSSRQSTASLISPLGNMYHRRLSSLASVSSDGGSSQLPTMTSPPPAGSLHGQTGIKTPGHHRASLLSPSPTHMASGLPQLSSVRKSTTFSPAMTQSTPRGALPAFRKMSFGKPPAALADLETRLNGPNGRLGESGVPETPAAQKPPAPPQLGGGNKENSTTTPAKLPATPMANIHARLDRQHPGLPQDRPSSPAVLAQKFNVGERVQVPSMGLAGTLKFLGPVHFKPGVWAGVHLDQDGQGKNDGVVKGTRYFECPPNCGIFVLAQKLEKVGGRTSLPPTPAGTRNQSTTSTPRALATPGTSRLNGNGRPSLGQPTPGRLGARATKYVNMSANLRRMGKSTSGTGGNERKLPSPTVSAATSNRSTPSRRMTINSVANTKNSRTSPGLRHDSKSSTPARARSPSLPSKPSGPERSLRPSSGPGLQGRRTTLGPLPNSRLLRDGKASDKSGSARATTPSFSNKLAGLKALSGASHNKDATSSPSTTEVQNGVSNESYQRVKLKLEMLEAENRVLRLENEQGRAQLEARQLIERDLIRQQLLEEQEAAQTTPTRGPSDKSNAGMLNSSSTSLMANNQEEWEREMHQKDEKIRSMDDHIAQLSEKLALLESPRPKGDKDSALEADPQTWRMSGAFDEDGLHNKLLQLTEAVQTKEQRIKDLEQRLASLTESGDNPGEVERLQVMVAQLEQQRAHLEQDNARVQGQTTEQAENMRQQIDTLQSRLDHEKREAQKSTTVIEELKSALVENERVVIHQKEDINTLISQMDTLVGKALRATQVIRELKLPEGGEEPGLPTPSVTNLEHLEGLPNAHGEDDPLVAHRERAERLTLVLEGTTQAVEYLQKVNHRLSMDMNSLMQEHSTRTPSPSEATAVSVDPHLSAERLPGSTRTSLAEPTKDGTGRNVAEMYNQLLVQHQSLQSDYTNLRSELRQKEDLVAALYRRKLTLSDNGGISPLDGSGQLSTSTSIPNLHQLMEELGMPDSSPIPGERNSLTGEPAVDSPRGASPSMTKSVLNDSLRELHKMVTEVEGESVVDVSTEVLSEEVLRLRERVSELQLELNQAQLDKDDLQQQLNTLEQKLQEATLATPHTTASESNATPGTPVAKLNDEIQGLYKIMTAKDDQIKGLKEAVANLEANNTALEKEREELVAERTRYIEEQELLQDHLNYVEAECNRLIDDIEILNEENARLSEELTTASAKSSLSLDVRALLGASANSLSESATGTGDAPSTPAAGAGDATASDKSEQWQQLVQEKQRQLEKLQQEHRLELRDKEKQLRELERNKNQEIESLNKDLSELETLIESKIFREADLEDRHAEAEKQIKKLQQEIATLQAEGPTGAGDTKLSLTSPTGSRGVSTLSSSEPGTKESPLAGVRLTGDSEDETGSGLICELCDQTGHDLFHCPLFKSTSTAAETTRIAGGDEDDAVLGSAAGDVTMASVFKNEPDYYETSRPFCDN